MSSCLRMYRNSKSEENASKRVNKTALKKMNAIEIVQHIISLSEDKPVSVTGAVKPYLDELVRRFNITPEQALFMSVFIDNFDDKSIRLRDIARHFSLKTCSMLLHQDVINELVKLNIVKRFRDDDEFCYRISMKTLNCIKDDKLPEPVKTEGLEPYEWMERLKEIAEDRAYDRMNDEEFDLEIQELIEKNGHLDFVKRLVQFRLNPYMMKIFLIMTNLFAKNNDDNIRFSDFEEYYESGKARHIITQLMSDSYALYTHNLIEHANNDGLVDPNAWKLTDYAKEELFAECHLVVQKAKKKVTKYSDIVAKDLFYSDKLAEQVTQLKTLLGKERMASIIKRLESKGMRKGFACLFYGAPGTGKTETAQQLARLTGRDIMLVDIPDIRDKWVGESEKNVKKIFTRYKAALKDSEVAPILLFNEADAIFTTRCEGGTDSVDKMENAMQNIILQEMETFEGIMIATTNLTGSLDPAFERRFLYKIEFDRPSAKIRAKIWQSMIPNIASEDAEKLAARYDFSGGQIENVARKMVVTTILEDKDDADIEDIIKACECESLHKDSERRIGF